VGTGGVDETRWASALPCDHRLKARGSAPELAAEKQRDHDENPRNDDANNEPTQLGRPTRPGSTDANRRKSVARTNHWLHAFPQNAQ